MGFLSIFLPHPPLLLLLGQFNINASEGRDFVRFSFVKKKAACFLLAIFATGVIEIRTFAAPTIS